MAKPLTPVLNAKADTPADPPGRQELGQDMMADGADQIDVRAGEAAGGQNKPVAGSSTRNARDR